MIRFIMNYFRSKDAIEMEECFRLKIYIDKIDTKSSKPVEFTVRKKFYIKELREKIAHRKKIKSDDIILFINSHFWEDNSTIEDALRGIDGATGDYIIYAVVITDKDKENINYDVEKHLKNKYSEVGDPEDDYGFDLNTVPVVCSLCQSSKEKDMTTILDYCGHQFCRDCLTIVVYESLGKNTTCPQKGCERFLTDHEIQKILGTAEYNKLQTLIARKSLDDDHFIIPKVGWICQSCTFLNRPFHKFCDTCNDNRPSKYMIPVFYQPGDDEKKIQEQEVEDKRLLDIETKEREDDRAKRLQELRLLHMQQVTFTNESTECPICVMDYEPGEAIVLHSCLHTVCRDCLKTYLVNIEDAMVKCPTENCIGLLEDQEIRAILSESQYEKYQELNLRMAEAKEKFSFHCKEVNCTSWFVNGGNLDHFDCPKCRKRNCVPCEAIHDGITCQEFQMKKLIASKDPSQSKNEMFIQSMINSGNAMMCPGCKMIVEKNRGCDGVLCRGCGMMICWATKGPRWGPKGKGDTSGGCGCRFLWGRRCHPNCHYCH